MREPSDTNSGLVRDTGATLLRQTVAVIAGLAVAILIARSLGPTGNGQYHLAVLLPTLLVTTLNLGLAPANVYFIARGDVDLSRAWALNLWLWLGLSIVGLIGGLAVVGMAGTAAFPGVPGLALIVALFALPLLFGQQLLASLLQGHQAFTLFNVVLIATPLSTLLAVAAVNWLNAASVEATLLAFIVGQGVGFATSAAAVLSLRKNKSPRGPAEPARDGFTIRSLLTYGSRAHLANLLTFLNYRADLFLVNLLLAPASAGVYVIAIQLAERLWLLSTAVSTVLLPRMSQLRTAAPQRSHALTSTATRWVLYISLLAAFAVGVLATWLIRLLFGEAYQDAGLALQLLLPGVVLGSGARVLSNDIAARGRPELNAYVAGVVLALNIAANLLLIPHFGLAGAAIATSLAYSSNFVAKVWLYSRLSATPWWHTLLPIRPHEAEPAGGRN
jgi:O-antigen/teichoic acid export membrane protein